MSFLQVGIADHPSHSTISAASLLAGWHWSPARPSSGSSWQGGWYEPLGRLPWENHGKTTGKWRFAPGNLLHSY